ncbi:MAG: YhgE/Pip domain-containing protein [Bifidobacterium pseudocatenulatum]
MANNDKGYDPDLIPVRVNVGETIISTLHANDQLDWQFVKSDKAIDGVKSGEYYTAIVIRRFPRRHDDAVLPRHQTRAAQVLSERENQPDRPAYHRSGRDNRGQHNRQNLRQNDRASRTRPGLKHPTLFAKPANGRIHAQPQRQSHHHGGYAERRIAASDVVFTAARLGERHRGFHGQTARLGDHGG